MNRPTATPHAPEPAYRRPRLIETEPLMFALGLVALVLAISLWRPAAPVAPQQAAPLEHSQTLAAAPQR